MKKWQLENKKEIKSEEYLIKILLENRNIKTKKDVNTFLKPNLSEISWKSLKIDKTNLNKSLKRIEKAIKNKENIIIFGDYDVDGICASAILWETLNSLEANALPYIPNRFDDGYGLSINGIDKLLGKQKVDLIITVDNGIVANDAVDYANSKGIDVIITDHHVPSKKLPNAFSIIHTTLLCGAGIAYILSKEIKSEKIEKTDNHLELVTLATIADLVPLKDANRTLVFHGLKSLNKTKRPGLLALFQKAGIRNGEVGIYEIGHIIAPRINAMGRLENAMDSLRLICTTDIKRASQLATLLSDTNFERQKLTLKSLEHAKNKVSKKEIKNLIFIADKSYQEGIVGLIAGRIAEEYYRPSIVISKGKKFSKASARSVKGFNIIEFLREASELLVDVGGHPMAAGFTVETKNLEALEKKLHQIADKLIKKEHLERTLRVDTNLPLDFINTKTYSQIEKLSPFGMANPEPTFLTTSFKVESLKLVGNDGKHLKLKLSKENKWFEAIAFGIGKTHEIKQGDFVDAVYSLDENVWNGKKLLQLKIKDLKRN
ncbi:MAG TPA: single-stranded-DNA-specific exonuclease RecJ [Candidatus Sulfotelmatobacter sp.]|nr:single-stranded-DNA-specific exonuclease RecJ [Candidatus Sulfotelmatobacter sp.]